MSDDTKSLHDRIAQLEHRLMVPQKAALSEAAAASASARQKAFGLSKRHDVDQITASVLAMADKRNLYIEYTIKDVGNTVAEPTSCCCCCCCCRAGFGAAGPAGGIGGGVAGGG